jgi:CPA2 family monovalent cation:H+ antiporter-2
VADALVGIGGAFLAAGIFARFGRRVGLPTIPFFMAAGIVFGPHTPGLALVEHPSELRLLATLGLILLMFHLGLELSLRELVAGGGRLLAAGAAYLVLNVGGGLAFGFALGWGAGEAFVIAGAVGISSTAIVTKLLVEQRRLAQPESRLILGIVVVEDVFLALYLALLQPILGEASPFSRAAATPAARLGRVAAANIGLTVLGRGELSLVLATLAAAAGLDERIAPFVAFYVLILAIAGPLLTACSERVAGLLPSRMLAPVGSP